MKKAASDIKKVIIAVKIVAYHAQRLQKAEIIKGSCSWGISLRSSLHRTYGFLGSRHPVKCLNKNCQNSQTRYAITHTAMRVANIDHLPDESIERHQKALGLFNYSGCVQANTDGAQRIHHNQKFAFLA